MKEQCENVEGQERHEVLRVFPPSSRFYPPFSFQLKMHRGPDLFRGEAGKRYFVGIFMQIPFCPRRGAVRAGETAARLAAAAARGDLSGEQALALTSPPVFRWCAGCIYT